MQRPSTARVSQRPAAPTTSRAAIAQRSSPLPAVPRHVQHSSIASLSSMATSSPAVRPAENGAAARVDQQVEGFVFHGDRHARFDQFCTELDRPPRQRVDQRRGIDDRGLRHNRGRGAIDPEQIGGGPSGQPLPGNRLDLRHRREVDLMDVTVMSAGGPAAMGAISVIQRARRRLMAASNPAGPSPITSAVRIAQPRRVGTPSPRLDTARLSASTKKTMPIPGAAAQQRVLRDAAKQPTCRARFARRHQHVAREKHVTWKQHIAGEKNISPGKSMSPGNSISPGKACAPEASSKPSDANRSAISPSTRRAARNCILTGCSSRDCNRTDFTERRAQFFHPTCRQGGARRPLRARSSRRPWQRPTVAFVAPATSTAVPAMKFLRVTAMICPFPWHSAAWARASGGKTAMESESGHHGATIRSRSPAATGGRAP